MQEPAHVLTKKEDIRQAAQWPQGRGVVKGVEHLGSTLHCQELVLVAKAPKGTTDHLIDEAARRLELCDARCQALPDAEVRRLPRHLVARPEQAGGDAANGPLARGRGRALMELDITSQVETQRWWRRDRRPEDDDRHVLRPSGAPEAAASGRAPQ